MNHNFEAPGWGLDLGSAGCIAVYLGIAAFLASAVLWLLPAPRRLAAAAFWAGTACVVAAIGVHISLLLTRQYEFDYVFRYTRENMSWPYRLSGAWAGQEGSFLLWVTTSAVIAAIAARSTGIYRRWYTVVCACALAAMLGICAYESPFRLIELSAADRAMLPPLVGVFKPVDGLGLNPTLQNYWMVIHPWVIFTGFGSLLTLFGWAASAAFSRNWTSWASLVRPWAVFSATILGLGLTMGGMWAYETLGWGGFWAWDPVENVSLVPFLASSVLIHTLYVQATRGKWARLNLIVGVMPFVWFAYGTYLTRSGALADVSVHSFARMNDNAHKLLLGIVLGAAAAAIGVGLIAAFKRRELQNPLSGGHRSQGIGWGMTGLYLVAGSAALGMSVPFVVAVFHMAAPSLIGDGAKGTVSEAVYDRFLTLPFVPALLLMGVAPLLSWAKTLPAAWNRAVVILYATFFVSGFALVPIMTRTMHSSPWVMFGILVSVWACLAAITSNVALLIQRRKTLGSAGAFVMHAGVAVLLLGLIVSHAFERTGRTAITADTPGHLDAGPLSYEVAMTGAQTGEQLVTPENRLDLMLVDDRGGHSSAKPVVFYQTGGESDEPQLVLRPSISRHVLWDTYLSVTSRETEMDPSPLEISQGKPMEVKIGNLIPATLTYRAKKLTGGMGLPGSTFGITLLIQMEGHTYTAQPSLELTDSGMRHHDVPVADEFGIRLDSLRAGDGVATISFLYPKAVYALELFFKPLTILVWLGAGLMTLGGVMTVLRLARRPDSSS